MRQFVADASHELRTPLATIHGYAELSRRTPGDPVALSGAMTKVETEADRMSRLVEDMLLLARLDSGRPLERGEVDLTKLLLESVADARVVDAQQGATHQWQLRLPEAPVTVAGDEQRLHQLFTNLLGNARHHTPPGTTVTISAAPGPDEVVVEVHDDGPGLRAGPGRPRLRAVHQGGRLAHPRLGRSRARTLARGRDRPGPPRHRHGQLTAGIDHLPDHPAGRLTPHMEPTESAHGGRSPAPDRVRHGHHQDPSPADRRRP